MKKLTNKSKYSYDENGELCIHLKLKSTGKWVIAYKCHASCLQLIKNTNSIYVENVILIPQKF